MTRPPENLRARVMAGLVLCRRPAVRTAGFAAAYAHAVAGLDALIRDLAADEWSLHVRHGWNVRETLGHVFAGDGALCARAHVPELLPVPDQVAADWEARTRHVLSRQRSWTTVQVRNVWYEQARSLLHADAARFRNDAPVNHGGRLVPLSDAYLARGLETWLHADDIGRAVGRRVPGPEPETMPLLVRLGTEMLETAHPRPERCARLTVHGPGSAELTLGSGPLDAEVALAGTDFCRLLGGNRAPDETPAETRGDPHAAAWLLREIAALAVL